MRICVAPHGIRSWRPGEWRRVEKGRVEKRVLWSKGRKVANALDLCTEGINHEAHAQHTPFYVMTETNVHPLT